MLLINFCQNMLQIVTILKKQISQRYKVQTNNVKQHDS